MRSSIFFFSSSFLVAILALLSELRERQTYTHTGNDDDYDYEIMMEERRRREVAVLVVRHTTPLAFSTVTLTDQTDSCLCCP